MPQSLSKVIVHLVFSTKNRYPFLDPDIRPGMHAYLATVMRDQGAEAYRVGGVADHVHLACGLPRTASMAKLMEQTKRESSKWIKRQHPRYTTFTWQRGYGAFSIAPSQLDQLIDYVDGQEAHHQHLDFQEEYRALLSRYGIAFDACYVWD